ncbi:MAG: hypothetical protein HOH04_03095 [Rhodospirillaceae bacterium]|nr:hypothetical protein [Rhodospirillaceae bacterium]
MMTRSLYALCFGALACAAWIAGPSDALAQQPKYSQWSDPTAPKPEDRLQSFIDKLNKMIDEAEKARAADPNFLRDLRDLTGGFDRPWRRQVLSDTFVDGDYTNNPGWTVSTGKYWVERGWGLRSAVKPGTVSAGNTATEPKMSPEQKAAKLFGSILNQALGGGNQGGQASGQNGGQKGTAQAPAAAIIHVPTAISNAFALELDMSSWAAEGQLQVALYQGQFQGKQSAGYRLSYQPGGAVELHRVSSRGTSIIDRAAKATPLEDKKIHRLVWERYPDGRMSVSINGNEVVKTSDRGFRDSFSGVALINGGGDYIIKSIAVSGTN